MCLLGQHRFHGGDFDVRFFLEDSLLSGKSIPMRLIIESKKPKRMNDCSAEKFRRDFISEGKNKNFLGYKTGRSSSAVCGWTLHRMMKGFEQMMPYHIYAVSRDNGE